MKKRLIFKIRKEQFLIIFLLKFDFRFSFEYIKEMESKSNLRNARRKILDIYATMEKIFFLSLSLD